jgi:hypothetical protein
MPNRVVAIDSTDAVSIGSSHDPRERAVVILDAETLEVVGYDSIPASSSPPISDSEASTSPE